jgi:hypothetical protein
MPFAPPICGGPNTREPYHAVDKRVAPAVPSLFAQRPPLLEDQNFRHDL